MYLIEMLIMLSEDEYEDVAAAATKGLRLYSEKCETHSGKSLLEILEDNFYNLVTKLPRILHGTGQYMHQNFLASPSPLIHLKLLLLTVLKSWQYGNTCQ